MPEMPTPPPYRKIAPWVEELAKNVLDPVAPKVDEPKVEETLKTPEPVVEEAKPVVPEVKVETPAAPVVPAPAPAATTPAPEAAPAPVPPVAK